MKTKEISKPALATKHVAISVSMILDNTKRRKTFPHKFENDQAVYVTAEYVEDINMQLLIYSIT